MMRVINYKKIRDGEEGNGAGIIVLFVAGIGVVWIVISFIYNSIYDTKEKRVEDAERARTSKGMVTTTTISREIAGYTVEFDQ